MAATDIRRTYCSVDMEKELLYSIRSCNAEKVSAILTDIFAEFNYIEEMPEPEYFISMYYELAYMKVRVLLEIVSQEDAAGIVRNVRDRNMPGSLSMLKLQEKLQQQLCRQCCELIERSRAAEASSIIEESVRYIRDHLHEDLSVQSSARLVHLS